MGIIDRSGQPRSVEDIDEALQAMMQLLIEGALSSPPRVILAIPTVLDALKLYKKILQEKEGG